MEQKYTHTHKDTGWVVTCIQYAPSEVNGNPAQSV